MLAQQKITSTSAKAAGGNIIIDSGTALTFLPSDLYTGFEAALKAQIKLAVVKDPLQSYSLCFDSPQSTFKVPTIIAHFTGGADVTLSAPNTFLGDETMKQFRAWLSFLLTQSPFSVTWPKLIIW